MPETIVSFFIVFASGLAYWFLFQILYEKKYRPLPYKSVLLTLILAGAGSWLLASVGNTLFMDLAGVDYFSGPASLPQIAAGSLIIGADEEVLKFFFTVFLAGTLGGFKHPPLVLAHAGATALGFATVESLVYGLQVGSLEIFLRAFTATPVHLGAAAIWSIGLAKDKFLSQGNCCKASACFLAPAVGAHAAYNFGCVALAAYAPALAVGFAVACGLAMLAVVSVCQKKLLTMHELRAIRARHGRCTVCGKLPETRHSYCSRCGAPLGIGFGLIIRPPALRTDRDTVSKTPQQ